MSAEATHGGANDELRDAGSVEGATELLFVTPAADAVLTDAATMADAVGILDAPLTQGPPLGDLVVTLDVPVGDLLEPATTEQVGEERTPFTEWVIRGVSVLTLVYAAYYLTWWWTSTLNPDALWLSIPLSVVETWGVLSFAAFVFTCWKLKRRPEIPAREGLSVAVFITTYGEPLTVIRKTALAAREIRYPHNTYILDDGNRDEVRALAEELGVRYLRRTSNEHAKAGNLNHALGQTSEEFILQLDADHVPLPRMLDRMLGYFQDERVAFVQSPHDFYNFDSFTHVVAGHGRRVWEEQRLFFHVIQPGKDRVNAAFFCGSCGVIRRKAFEEIGGFSTETITEDVETSLRLHSRGWKSAYVDETLAFGLAPGSLIPYQVQRLRWGQGSMQILRKFNPLFLPGLTLAQRISYLHSLVHYLDGIRRLVLITTPLIFFFTGVMPVVAVEREFLVRLFVYVFLMLCSFELLSRGSGYIWISERFEMIRWPLYLRAVTGLFTKKRLRFKVTPKGDEGRPPMRAYFVQLMVVVLSAVAVPWAMLAQSQGWIDYGFVGWSSGAFLVGGFWLLWNAGFTWAGIRRVKDRGQEEDYRFPEAVPIRFHLDGREGLDANPGLGMTHLLAASGLRFLSTTEVDANERIRLHLRLSTGAWELTARVTGRGEHERAGVRMFDYLVSFDSPSSAAQLGIDLHCMHHAVPAKRQQLLPLPDLFEDVRLWFRERRTEPRTRVHVPAQIGVLEDGGRALTWHAAVLEEMSGGGMLLLTEREIGEDAWVRCQVPGAALDAEGIVRHARPVVTPLGCRWELGIECASKLGPAVQTPKPRRRRWSSRARERLAANPV
jgi:cellulose synthase (UDP-forming)